MVCITSLPFPPAGEYVAVERVENAYKMCPVVDQLWVYGSSFENFLVAVVVPKEPNLRQVLQQQGIVNAASMSFQVGRRTCQSPKHPVCASNDGVNCSVCALTAWKALRRGAFYASELRIEDRKGSFFSFALCTVGVQTHTVRV
eukprot:1152901-Pelagomonas_calceolata.AAC.25